MAWYDFLPSGLSHAVKTSFYNGETPAVSNPISNLNGLTADQEAFEAAARESAAENLVWGADRDHALAQANAVASLNQKISPIIPTITIEDANQYPVSNTTGYTVEAAPMEPLPEAVVATEISKNPLSKLNSLSDADLVKAVLAGKYGNGVDRKAALGDRYASIQALVNKKLSEDSKASSSKISSTKVPLVNNSRSKWQRDMTPAEIEALGYSRFNQLNTV